VNDGFLREIVASVRATVRRPEYLAGLPTDAGTADRRLRTAIEQDAGRGALLVEYKRVSPGQAVARLPARTPSEFVRATRGARVSGYSCLATPARFDGSPSDVAEVVRHTDRPVLFKDFVVDPVQLEAARRVGASAVLLIARLETEGLLDRSLAELASAAHEHGLEVLLELHGRSELSVARGVAADMFGVNVRNLATLAIDRPTAEATIDAAREAGLRPLLGLSGVETPEDARRFWDRGVDGILVGTQVARAAEPVRFLRSLRRPNPEATP
jgi:indole-3-glycerol phosphate synthase